MLSANDIHPFELSHIVAFRYRYLAIQEVGGKAKYQTGTNTEAVLPSAEIVGHVAGEKFRFNSSDGKPVADTNLNSATC
jgi:hypothetical protein